MNLGDMRAVLRERLEVEFDDWPDLLIDTSIADGYRRVLGRSSRWPWLETVEDVAVPGGQATTTVGVRDVMDITVNGSMLRYDDEQHMTRMYGPPGSRSGVPRGWSYFADTVTLWPTPSSDVALRVRGWRAPRPFEPLAGWEPDLPDGFDTLLLDWAMADEYQRQDDMEMSLSHREKFESQATALQRSTESRPTVTPIVVNSRTSGR